MTLLDEIILTMILMNISMSIYVNIYNIYYCLLKGVQIKSLVLNFCFAHISAFILRIFKILVPTPHNKPQLCGVDTRIFKIRCIEAEI